MPRSLLNLPQNHHKLGYGFEVPCYVMCIYLHEPPSKSITLLSAINFDICWSDACLEESPAQTSSCLPTLKRVEAADHEPNMHLRGCKRKNDVVAFLNFHLATALRALGSWP